MEYLSYEDHLSRTIFHFEDRSRTLHSAGHLLSWTAILARFAWQQSPLKSVGLTLDLMHITVYCTGGTSLLIDVAAITGFGFSSISIVNVFKYFG